MNGTRQGDFSRFSFDPRKRFSAVRVQQGRVQLDSDFNESSDILTHRLRTAAADLLGASGAPAGAPGFGLEVSELGLELGLDGHFVLIGGSEGFTPAGNAGVPPGASLELRLLLRGEGPSSGGEGPSSGGEGQIFGCWVRRENDGRFKPVYALRYAGERLWFQRPGLSDLVTSPLPGLAGRPAAVALHWSEHETLLEVDGRTVARDANGVDLPPGPILLLVGSRQPPHLSALVSELRLWSGLRGREVRARQAGEELGGGEAGLAGWWRFDAGVDELIPDRSRHRNDAVVRGSAQAPRWLPSEILVGPGRYYLGGLLCESLESIPFSRQVDLPSARLPAPRSRDREHHLLYLDVWERSITALEDPDIREVALGGADTTVRDQVVAQVRSLPLPAGTARLSARELHEDWPALIAPLTGLGRLLARRRHVASSRLENRLYRVEIHDAGDGHVAAVQEVASVAADNRARTRLRLTHLDGEWRTGQPVEVFLHGTSPQDQPRRLARVLAIERGEEALVLDLDLGPQGRATELRVRRIATFKWSRNNAGLVFPLAPLDSGNRLAGLLPTPGGTAGLEAGVWVEVVDDRLALAQEAAPLHRVESVDALKLQVALDPPPAEGGWEAERHPLLRVWDQKGKGLTAWGTVPAMGGDWQELEGGIQIRFAYDGPYRTGDYWWMAARTLSQDVDWPRDGRGTPRLLPPHGVAHHRAPLALLTYHAEGYHLLDLRRTFQPYVDGAVSKAGDWMEGPLDVRAGVAVRGDLLVEGSGRLGEIYGPLRSPDAVGTAQIQDRAVTPAKLSEGVGLVPDGWSILGASAQPPHGFVDSGWALSLFQANAPWLDRRQLPGGPPGPLACAALGGRIYALLDSGLLWEYDPAADAWSRRPEHPLPARGAAFAALDGRLYAAGGLDSLGRASRRTFAFDPAANSWIERAPLATGRSGFPLVACNGRLHALGGLRDSPTGKCTTSRHEAYDPLTDSWSRRRPLPERLHGSGGAALGVWVHLVGGERHWLAGRWGRALAAGHHQYSSQADRWVASRAPLPTPRRHLRLVETFGRLYAVGGESELGWLRDFEGYDPTADRWSPSTPLHEPIDDPGACALAGSVWVAGALRGGGALIEECPVATQLFVHRRAAERGSSPRVEAPLPALPEAIGVTPTAGAAGTGNPGSLGNPAARALADHPLDRR